MSGLEKVCEVDNEISHPYLGAGFTFEDTIGA